MAWENQYREHSLWSVLDEALEAIAEIPSDDIDDDILRLRSLLTGIAAYSDSPHATLTDAHLSQVEACVEMIRSSIPDDPAGIFEKPASNRNGPTLFAQLAQQVRSWPATGTVRLIGLGSRAEQVERDFEAFSDNIDARLKNLKAQLADSSETTSSALEQQQEDLARMRDSHVAFIEEKTDELKDEVARLRDAKDETEATIEQQKDRLHAVLTSHQEEFSKHQEERSEKWSEFVSKNQADRQEHLGQMHEHQEQSRKVLEAIGSNATATDYGSYANDQAKTANRWRMGAVAALTVAAIAFLIAAALSFFDIGADLEWWQALVQKVGAPAGAAAVGYVMIRESSQHRYQERNARQVELTLAALEPFITNLPSSQQEQIRVETARSIFAQRRDLSSHAEGELTAAKDDSGKPGLD